jgi:hypothetical protein
MSFSITTEQMRNRTKTVTRRLGWSFLKPGDVVNAVEKAMGLKPGEKIKRICQIRILDVRREQLADMLDGVDYGFQETTLEGFPEGTDKHWPSVFVDMFCRAMKCKPETEVNRIAFEFV